MSRLKDAPPMPAWLRVPLLVVAVANAVVAVLCAYKGIWLLVATSTLLAVVFAAVLFVDNQRRTRSSSR